MPDFGVQQPDLPQLPQAPATLLPDSSASVAPPVLSPMDRYNQATQNANSNLPAWAQDSNSQFVTPFKTNLDQTLRYSDPNIGFDPNDSNLEDKYANAHWLKTFGNNILQGGARFLGGAAETIGTIPLAIDAAVNNDFSKLYDNDLTNGINSWLNTLNTTLPIYQTNFERDHPVLKYLDPLKPGSFLGGVGGAFNNFGFMAGAIAGSMVEDAVITAATGGVGFFPGLAANGAQLTKMLGRAGRAIASAPEDIKAAFSVTRYSEEEAAASAARVAAQGTTDTAPSIVPAGSEVSTTLRPNGEGINSQNLQNFDEVSSSQKVDELQQAIKNNANYYKIRDAVKYNLAMLSSATSQAAFNAADVYKNGVDQLKQQYLEDNGTVPVDDALDNIKKISHQSANVTMGANIALLDIMNRINWGSLFKPTTTAFDNAITGWGGSITRSTVEKDATTAGNTIYNVVSKAPENTIGKVLLNGEKILNKSYIGIDQVAQQGGLFAINQGAMDYNLRKYNAQNRGELVDGMQSFMTGIDKTFNTNEGWDAMMGGFIGGIFGTGLMNKIMEGRGQTTAEKQLKIQADLLNHYSFNGTFENKMQEAAVQSSLASDYKDHVENQDMFNAKNIKHEMLYNWVASGIRANSFDQRMEELDAVRDLQGKSFQDYWGKEDNLQNRSDINSFLDDIQKKANGIKTNYNRIDLLSQNPYDPIKESADHEAFESYKDQLALNLSKSDDYRERIQSMKDDLYKVNPLLDIQKAINLTSISGMRETLNGIDKSRTDINEQIRVAKETKMGQDFTSDLVNKGKALDKLFNKLQPLINDTKVDDYGNVIESGFNGKDYTDVLQNLYDLHDGGDFTNSKYVNRFTKPNVVVDEQGNASVSNHDKLAENLQSLQDIYKLGEANLNVQRYYNFLRKGVGATEYSNRLKSLSIEDLKKYMGKEGTIKSPDEIKQDIEEETRFDTPEPENMEEASKDERDQLTATAKKVVNGDALSDDEQKLSQEKPTRFAHEVKIQQAVQEKMTERFGEPTTDNQIKPKTGNAIKVSNLFGMFSQDKGDIKNRTNLYNAIFKNKDGVFNKLTAAYSKTDVKDTTYTKIPNTQLYRSTFGEEITISHDGKPIGILRPQDSMWLDAEGKRSIYDMTKEEFSGIIGHPITNYDNFMGELKAYQDAYNKFKDKLSKGNIESSDYDLIKQYFDLSINTGASVQNRYTIANVGGKFHVMNPEGNVEQRFDKVSQAQDWIKNNNKNLSRFDTVIKDLNYKPKGTVLLSFTDDVELGGGSAKNNRNIHIVNEADLTQEQLGKVHLFINNNKDALSKNANRYALIVPIDGEYKNKAVIFARNAETQQDERGNFFSSIKDAANGVINGDKLTELADKLNKEFFFANQDRTVKQTYIHLSFSDNGDLILDINNPNSKSYNRITLDKAEIQNSGSYGDLMKNIQSKISDEGQKDKAFGKLAVFLGEDSLKRQIPDDEDIKHLSQVENKMSAATTPSIFTNYNINFTPKGYTESAGNKVETKPVEDNTNKSILPQELAGAKPRYSYQDKNFKLNFENDVDKAAYITAQTKRSNRDADYLKFAMDNTGLSEPEVRALGSQIRAKIKETAKDSNEESIDVPKTYKPKVVEKDVVDATKAVTDEYKQKRAELQKEFNDSLTPEEARIKKEVRQNPALASDTAALSKIANASTADIESYSKKASIYNEQFRIYDAIQKQKLENPTKTDTAIYAKTKAGIHTIAKDLFGLNKEQAQSVSDIFDLNANAWAKRTGNSVADYYKQLGFKNQLEEGNSDDILNQIIGEHGAKNLIDNAKITQDLQTAKDMDSKSMYSRSQIKAATQWEKGGDGKWRYETNYGKLTDKVNNELEDNKAGKFIGKLKDIYDNEELYKAYPELGRLTVNAKIQTRVEGKYDGNDRIEAFGPTKASILETLIHEVQHGIQLKEGFARGGNPDNILETLYQKYKDKDKFNEYKIVEQNRTINGIESKGYVVNDEFGWNGPNIFKTREDAQAALDIRKNEMSHLANVYNEAIDGKLSDMDAYRRLAGEVESRNAETRSKMTPEQRANNTLVSTEDIDEGSKIYISGTGDNLNVSPELVKNVNSVVDYLGLYYKKSGANSGGFTKNGVAGKELYNRVMDVIKEKGLEEKVGARLDLQNNTIQFYNRDKQGTLFQNEGEAKGAYNKVNNVIYALKSPDVTTPLHELAHSWESHLNDDERQQVLDWSKETGSTDTGWTRDTSERFASGFEKYLAEGKAPTKGLETIFKKFAKWMGDVITKVKSIFGDKFELNDNMRSIYAKMIDSDLVKNDANIETKTKEAVTPEEVKDNKPLTNEANIDYDTALDGSSKIYVKDNNGKTIPNPNNELDNSFKLDEAKQFIKDYNDKLENKEEIKAPLEPEKVPEEQPQPEKTPEEQPQPEEQSDRVIKPLNEDEKTDYGKISKIQQGIKDGFYEDKIRKGELTETQVKDIMVSAGLRKTVVDGMVFRIENADLLKALKDGIPEGVNISYLRSDINGAIKDGRFGEAIRNGEIPTDKAKGILKYFNIDDSKFKDDFEAVEKQKAENLAPQESKPITSEDMDFINVLKQHLDDLNGIYGNIIKDKIDSEDYTGAMDDIREFFTDDIKQAKKIFNNDDVYKAFLDATDLKEGDTSTADEFANKHSDIFSPEEVPEKQAINDKYVTYKEKDENGNVVERPAKVVENNGFTSLIETPDGKQFDRVTDQLKPTTKDEFDLLKPKDPKPTSMDNAKYSAGDKVVYGQDKQEFTIVSAETRVNDKGVNETFYNTEEGPMISEDGIRNMARETKVSKILDIKKGQEKRQKVLERIAKRFTQLFPDIKYEIGNFDFNAPARFNKGIVELNVGYNDVRYTRGEINEARYNDILNTPWLKRESVAHEFMHPFVAALKMSNEVLYNNLIKELQKTQPDILAHVDKLIKGGTYDESNRNDEALTIYLGKSITEAFTKDGELNTEYAKTRSKSLVKRFFDWINNMMDYLTGKRSKVSLEDFVKNANTDLDAQRNDIRSAIKDVPSLQELYSKEHNNDLIKTIKYIKRVGAEAFDEDGSINYEKYQKGIDDIIDDLNKHQDAKEQKGANLKATIHERPKLENPVYKVEVNGEDRFIQREIGNDFDQWHEVTKNGEAWENKDRTDVSFTKQDMLDNLAKEIKGKNTIDREDVSNVVDKVSDLLQQKNTGRFEFIIQPNEDTDVRFDQTDNNHIKVYVDPSFSNDISATDTMLRYGQRDIVDNEAAEEFKNLVQRNYYKGSNSKETSNEIGVSALNPFMRLQDVSDFMVKQLYDGNTNSDVGLKIVYSNPELDAIDQLEAYMDLTNEDADKIRKTIVNRLKQLKDTADVRLKSDVLKTQYAIVNRLALDENSTDFVLKYIERAGIGINLAWRKFNEIRQDLKDPNMTSAKLSRLNKEIDVVKQLVSFYDDFSKLYNNYDEYFKDEDLVKFAKSVSNWQRIRENMNETSINLAVKWMLPYAEKHNKYITKEGFTDPKYLVSEETLYNNFKFGTDKDVNFITYNLGANVTSRDPVNAIFTNIVADMLSVNNIKIVNDSFDINDGYVKFLKDNNLSNTNNKAQEDFYKKNYLRKAEILQSVYNKEKGEYEDKYVEKWALHQEFKFDQYQKDYAIERDKYKDPRDGDQAELFAEKLNKWQEDNKYGRSEKYRNNDYTKLQNDSYFKLLSHHYDVNNMKYGENHLLFGIVPQKYDVSMLDKLKNFISGAKTAKGRDEIKDNALRNIAGIKKDNTSENLDDTKFRIIKSNLNQLKSDDNIDLNLHSSIIDMVTEATNYGSLKDVQYNVENVRALIDGNDHFNMPGRKIGKEDFEANIRSLQQVRQAKRDLKPLQALKDAGQPYNEELYNKLTARVEKGAAPQKFWDRFATTVKRSDTNRLNEQLTQFINDSFYGEAVEEAKIGNISLNKAAHYVSMYTSINNMAFNTVAGVSNVVIGDVQMMIEAHGGKYFNKKDLAWATKDYFANMANYIGDMKNPIKSKDTQISFLLDAIQGEVLDEFGNRISGNISRRMFNAGSLFFFTTVGEHQIQTIGMKAMLRAQKVQTNDGKTISLYDAFQADASGRYKLRNDTNFSSDDLQHFIRQLHGVNRSLNGNYSDLHKSVLQRKWYGTLALKFRKYIYESFRSRYSGERVDFEKNTVEHGYMNFFLKDYLYKNFRDLPWSKKFNFAENYNNLTPNQKYFVRKSGMEFGMFLGLLVTTSALFGSTHDKDKKDLSTVDKTLLLYSLRLQNDLGMFHVQMPSEAQRQIQSPTASMTSIVALTNFLGQLYKPTEEYQQKGSGYDAGDSKLAAKFKKLLPVISKFPIDVDSKLGYFDMVNQNIQGVSRKQSH